MTNRGAGQRYEIWLGPPGATSVAPEDQQWYRHLTFRELDRAMTFMEYFDPDGMIPMRVYDLWKKRDVDVIEYFQEHERRVKLQRARQMLEEERGDWRLEGF